MSDGERIIGENVHTYMTAEGDDPMREPSEEAVRAAYELSKQPSTHSSPKDKLRDVLAAAYAVDFPIGAPPADTVKAEQYLREFIAYAPGTAPHPQREKAESCLNVLLAALRGVAEARD